MRRVTGLANKSVLGCALALAVLAPLGSAHAGFKVLYTFRRDFPETDGWTPSGGLIRDASGNLFGTTADGGANNSGTVFKLTPTGKEITLYSFMGGSDGMSPGGGVIADAAHNLYGTTLFGGTGCGGNGCGTVYKVNSKGRETVLHSFGSGNDGSLPYAGLIADSAGNLYGTTFYGGNQNCSPSGCGIVFELAPDGTETVVYAFGGADGQNPYAGLIADAAGNFYGTTFGGGSLNCSPNLSSGCGTVFQLAPDGTESVLYAFSGGTDGANPAAGMIADTAGNLYGTTEFGGGTGCGGSGCGTVFKLASGGTETVLHVFGAGSDGTIPAAGLLADAAGNLYGTTESGGANNKGTVFKLAPDGTETVLHAFDGKDGDVPLAGLIADARGRLYGTTVGGGGGEATWRGVVFRQPE